MALLFLMIKHIIVYKFYRSLNKKNINKNIFVITIKIKAMGVTGSDIDNIKSLLKIIANSNGVPLARMSASVGCELIADTTERTGKVYTSFLVQENSVIGILTGGTSGVTTTNFLTSIGLSGKTLIQGALIVAPEGSRFTNLKLTSGSIIAYS